MKDTESTRTQATSLESLREEMALAPGRDHQPQWRIAGATDNLTWIFDGKRAVGMVCEDQESFELRCASPECECPPAVPPKHYHTVTQAGVRIIYTWQLQGKGCGERTAANLAMSVDGDTAVVNRRQQWSDGTRSQSEIRLRYHAAWGAYVADVRADLMARLVITALEYCNILPAGIGDSRPGRERYSATFWRHPDGPRKIGKNPLWWVSTGAQDLPGRRRIAPGGFLGFGPDDLMNPVVDIIHTDPPTGAGTCDNLQDEHIYALPTGGRHAADTGWFLLHAHYRLLSIPREMAERIIADAQYLDCGAMLAWKFQYPRLAELPDDLTRVELPGSPFYGKADWSVPVPWDKPYNGRLWTASPDPAAPVHWDRTAGRERPGAIRLRAAGGKLAFSPGSGHTLHTEEGTTYRFSIWIKTAGDAHGWIEAAEILFHPGDSPSHPSPKVGPDSDWTYAEAAFTARGDDAPFADTVLCAEGNGQVWFTGMAFEPVS
jgi:hypothetical protein